jgi:hypothetical protein
MLRRSFGAFFRRSTPQALGSPRPPRRLPAGSGRFAPKMKKGILSLLLAVESTGERFNSS